MTIPRRPLRIIAAILLLALASFIGFRVFQFYHIQGFKKSMELLVETGTNGKYSLEIGKTDIDYGNFAFTIDSLVIRKNDRLDSTGILAVTIPDLFVDLGPVHSMITSPQFLIDNLTISEPVAQVGVKKPGAAKTPKFQPINIPNKIATFYPVVKAILDHFNVKHFQIDRAGIELENSASLTQIRLLDLLVTNWNMRDLSDQAKVHLSLGNQSLNLPTSEFSFSSVVWDYHKKELDILDYRFIQKDTSQREIIHVEGVALKIFDLDYNLLIEEEEYAFKGLLIDQPLVTAHIHPKRKKLERNVHPLSDILKRNFGSLMIGEGEIRNARIDLTIYRDKDTVGLYLPSMNLTAENFSVNEDSTTLMIENLNLDVHETELDFGGDWVFKYHNLFYDEDHNALLDSLEIKHRDYSKPVLQSDRIELFNFNTFHFIYENILKVDSIHLNDAVMIVDGDILIGKDELPKANPSANRPTFDIGRLRLDNVDISAHLGDQTGKAHRLTGVVDGFTFDKKANYSFRYIHSPSVLIEDQQTSLSFKDLLFESKSLKVAGLQGNYRGIEISGEGILAVPSSPFLDKPLRNDWKLFSVADLSFKGQLIPTKKTNTPMKETEYFHLTTFNIGALHIDVELSDTTDIFGELEHVTVDSAYMVEGVSNFKKLALEIEQLAYTNKEEILSMGKSSIDNQTASILKEIRLSKPGFGEITVDRIDLSPFNVDSKQVDITAISIEDVVFAAFGPEKKTSTVDSIKLVDIQLASNQAPHMREILVYQPNINLKSTKNNEQSTKTNPKYSPMDMFSKLWISPGELNIGSKSISFGHIEVQPKSSWVDFGLHQLAFKTEKSSIHISDLHSDQSNLYIDSIFVVPTNEYVSTVKTETDIISAQIDRVQYHDVVWDSLIASGQLIVDEMSVNGFELSIKRDKTLPDPEPLSKPYLLREFIPIPEKAVIPKISASGGTIVYMEIGEKTGKEGHVAINDINVVMNRNHPVEEPEHVSFGSGLIYNQGKIEYDYHRLDSGKFSLTVQVSDLPLELLNQMVDSLEAAKFKSGHLHDFEFTVIGDGEKAEGQAEITYDDLHVEIFKKHQPDVRNFGSTLLSLLVDKIILKHSKSNAKADFVQERITFKGPINYWVKSGIHGASATVMKGKSDKKSKRTKRKTKRKG